MSAAQPKAKTPDQKWQHYAIWEAVRSAIFALPSRFESDLVISDVLAPDLYAFNWPHNTLTANHPKTGGPEIPSEQGK
jgi:hypothetical protein